MAAQLFSGTGLGLLLGLLLGLSTSPVVALVVGALATLLSSLVLPRLAAKPGDAEQPEPGRRQHQRVNDWRAGALGLACAAGLIVGIWLRAHDALSPKPPTLQERMEELKSLGFAPDQARRIVVLGPRAADSAASAADAPPASAVQPKTFLFADKAERCDRLAPQRFATIEAAAGAYAAAGETEFARIARHLQRLPDPAARKAALTAVVDALCAAE